MERPATARSGSSMRSIGSTSRSSRPISASAVLRNAGQQRPLSGVSNASSTHSMTGHEGFYSHEIQERKKAEFKLQTLLNRIALLHNEENKIITKVIETKERGMEILSIKKRNEDVHNRRKALHLYQQHQIAENTEKAVKQRQDNYVRKQISKEIIAESKKMMAFEIKEKEKQIVQKISYDREEVARTKRIKAQQEKERKELFKQKFIQDQIQKEAMAKKQFEDKVLDEKKRREECEALLAHLELQEKELINRLNDSKKMQDEAYEFLHRTVHS